MIAYTISEADFYKIGGPTSRAFFFVLLQTITKRIVMVVTGFPVVGRSTSRSSRILASQGKMQLNRNTPLFLPKSIYLWGAFPELFFAVTWCMRITRKIKGFRTTEVPYASSADSIVDLLSSLPYLPPSSPSVSVFFRAVTFRRYTFPASPNYIAHKSTISSVQYNCARGARFETTEIRQRRRDGESKLQAASPNEKWCYENAFFYLERAS